MSYGAAAYGEPEGHRSQEEGHQETESDDYDHGLRSAAHRLGLNL
ncbi:MAG: hypothetical protein OK452_08965 [Thaumarchaeota archaeon]|nr:hypothetical protein [Nitrososphaerota archaeon]